MTIVAHATVVDVRQADGRRYIVHEFETTAGERITRGPNLVQPSFDADADRLRVAPLVENALRTAELFRAENRALAGDSFGDIRSDLVYNTVAQVGGFVLKRMSNRMRRIGRHELETELPALLLLRRLMTQISPAHMAAWMGQDIADVSAWINRFSAMVDGIQQYQSPFPEFTDVPRA